jgi:hypothetical protein
MFSRPSGGLGALAVERPLFVPLLGLPGGLTSLCDVLSCGLNSRPKPAVAEFGALLNSAPLMLSTAEVPFCNRPALSAVSSVSSSPLSAILASWLAAASAMARANSSKSPVKLLQRERRTTLCRWCGGGSWWKWWCPLWLWVSLRGADGHACHAYAPRTTYISCQEYDQHRLHQEEW